MSMIQFLLLFNSFCSFFSFFQVSSSWCCAVCVSEREECRIMHLCSKKESSLKLKLLTTSMWTKKNEKKSRSAWWQFFFIYFFSTKTYVSMFLWFYHVDFSLYKKLKASKRFERDSSVVHLHTLLSHCILLLIIFAEA